MTLLTSEQYRDVIKHIPGCTEDIPSVQILLRRAVETFFNRFGTYPEVGGVSPGKIAIFGEQIQFSEGLALSAAIPLATVIVGRKVPGNNFAVVTSADVGKPHKIKFSSGRGRPLPPFCPSWVNRVKGVVDNFEEGPVPAFQAAIESSVPLGVGFGSSAALEVATYFFLEMLAGKISDPFEKAKVCQRAEAYAGKSVGLVDRITCILAKDRHLTLLDCKTNDINWIPFNNPQVVFVAVDPHVKDSILGNEYFETTKYFKKALELLQVQSLRNLTEDDLTILENKVNEMLLESEEFGKESNGDQNLLENSIKMNEKKELWSKEDYDTMVKRTRFFLTEIQRIKEAVNFWSEGDAKSFGEIMNESHEFLKNYFGFHNPVLDFFVKTSLQVEGVLGSKMVGMGLNYGGAVISIMNKKVVEKYCTYLAEKFSESEEQLQEELTELRKTEKQIESERKKRWMLESVQLPFFFLDEFEGKSGEPFRKRSRIKLFDNEQPFCISKRRASCLAKVVRKRVCDPWAHYEKEKSKDLVPSLKKEKKQKKDKEREDTSDVWPDSSKISEISKSSKISGLSEVRLKQPTFYLISPFAGARMMFVTKSDILRSLHSHVLPQTAALVRSGLKAFKAKYNTKAEAVGLAPATVILFGDFMEFHLGYIITMGLPMVTVTVGGRNDSASFSVETLSKEVEKPTAMKNPLPCVRSLVKESRSWANFVAGTVNEFKGHVPGFDAIVHSSIPVQIGVHSCAALQASIYTFLEKLTRNCTTDPFEKADRCGKTEYEFFPAASELVTHCSSVKFFPTFMSKEGHLMFINCRRYKISHYFFDHPSYVFLLVTCKENTTNVTVETLEERLKQCMKALEILGKNSLLTTELKHLRCLEKRDASEEVIKRARYVITEHQRTMEAIKAIKVKNYEKIGTLLSESHASLRDDYEVSSPEIETLIRLATEVEGVLGAKMLGRGLYATIIVLVNLSDAETCIKYIKKNYNENNDKPNFYITKPSRGAFSKSPEEGATSLK